MDGYIEQNVYTNEMATRTFPIPFKQYVESGIHAPNRDAFGNGNVQNYQFNIYVVDLTTFKSPSYGHFNKFCGY